MKKYEKQVKRVIRKSKIEYRMTNFKLLTAICMRGKAPVLWLLLLLLSSLSVHSQSLVLIYKGKELGKDAVIFCDSIDVNLGFMKVDLGVKNPQNSAVEVNVNRANLSVITGSSNSFCWGQTCYPASANESKFPVIVPANSTIWKFYADYVPVCKDTGRSIVEYRFADINNRSNSASVTVHYIEGLKCTDSGLLAGEYLQIIPSGMEGIVRVSFFFGEKTHLVFYNLTGQITGECVLYPGTGSKTLEVKSGRAVSVYSLVRHGKIIQSGKIPVR